jgi:hypothetical protein
MGSSVGRLCSLGDDMHVLAHIHMRCELRSTTIWKDASVERPVETEPLPNSGASAGVA